VPDDLLGQAVKCPACHHTFTAPESRFESAASPATTPFEQPSSRPVLFPESEVNQQNTPRPAMNGSDVGGSPIYPDRFAKPDKVQLMGYLTLFGGVVALIWGIGWSFTCVGLLFPAPYCFVVGVMAVIKGANLLTSSYQTEKSPKAIAIMQIVNMVALDIINLALGIVTLNLLSEPEVKAYFRD
jgi:hypothetical protein